MGISLDVKRCLILFAHINVGALMREFIKAPRLEINVNTTKMASHRKLNKK